jgi:hypothetical protein
MLAQGISFQFPASSFRHGITELVEPTAGSGKLGAGSYDRHDALGLVRDRHRAGHSGAVGTCAFRASRWCARCLSVRHADVGRAWRAPAGVLAAAEAIGDTTSTCSNYSSAVPSDSDLGRRPRRSTSCKSNRRLGPRAADGHVFAVALCHLLATDSRRFMVRSPNSGDGKKRG